jgi:hypothetical protein
MQVDTAMQTEREECLLRAATCRALAKRLSPEHRAQLLHVAAGCDQLAQESAIEEAKKVSRLDSHKLFYF